MINSIKKILIKALDNFNLVIINKNQRIIELSNQDEKLIDLVANFSMTPKIRIYNLLQALRYVKQKSIEGDFVEC